MLESQRKLVITNQGGKIDEKSTIEYVDIKLIYFNRLFSN